MSLFQELSSLALQQHNTEACNKLDSEHAALLKNGDTDKIRQVIEDEFGCQHEKDGCKYACEVMVTEY